MPISTYTDGVGDALRSIGDYATGLVAPTVRLGVTGLARSGKTVFITALRAQSDRRRAPSLLRRVGRRPPRSALIWSRSRTTLCPDSTTRRISPISPPRRRAGRRARGASASSADAGICIAEILEASARPRPAAYRHRRLSWRMAARLAAAPHRLSRMVTRGPRAGRRARPQEGAKGVAQGTRRDRSGRRRRTRRSRPNCRTCSRPILSEARSDLYSLSTLPPGRFLMPGELAGSPALTFAPLDPGEETSFARGSFWSMMERRYEAYKTHVVRPFFRDHFARLDRQIVLIDVLAALNDGAEAVSRSRALHDRDPRMLQDRRQHSLVEPVRAAHRSHRARRHQGRPLCITKATTGSRRSSPSSQGGPWRAAEFAGAADEGAGACRGARDTRGRGEAERRDAALHRRLSACRRDDRQAHLRRQRGVRHLPRRSAQGPRACAEGLAHRAWRHALRALPAAEPDPASLPEASLPSQISGSTAPSRR